MKIDFYRISIITLGLAASVFATAQNSSNNKNTTSAALSAPISETELLLIERANFDSIMNAQFEKPQEIPVGEFGPVVFDGYKEVTPISLYAKPLHNPRFAKAYGWLDDAKIGDEIMLNLRQNYEFTQPTSVLYNSNNMPDVPKEFRAYVDKVTTRIKFDEFVIDGENLKKVETNVNRKIWLHTFNASLQFSQAYISPNWYQGGNNNLNVIGQLLYNIKLNQKYYPNYLFETTVQYKLALNSAPDDSIHSINITEDLFQINSTMGYKAAKNWYYSANILFKTQLFNSYPTNSRSMKAAFMSPGELNVGLGMTYSFTNKKKTLDFGASISPLSWNLKTCTNPRVNETTYGLEAGTSTKNKVGSSAELTLAWKIAYNIIYHSRLFFFTDYDYAYTDWEHTIDFNINRFLSTRLYVHMRYDTSTPQCSDLSWKKFQLKEIFSFGVSYNFSTI